MPTNTPNLNLVGYNTTTDSQAKFLTFRNDIAGAVNSNNTKIDTWAGTVNKKLVQLEDVEPNVMVNSTWVSTGYYEALVPKITAYKLDTIITFRPSQDNDGTTILKINELDVKSLMKYDNVGGLKNLDPKDLRKNHEYQFRYDGTSWVWQGGSSADQTNIVGDVDNFIMIDENNNLVDSGVDKAQVIKNTSDIGDVTKLITEDKTSVVSAINENLNKITVLSNSALQYRGTFSGNIGALINKEHQGMWYITYPNTGLPSGQTGGYLEVIYNPNPNYCKHIFRAVGSVLTFENDLSNGTWSGWKQITTTDQTLISLGVISGAGDLNTFTQPQTYAIVNSSTGILNTPPISTSANNAIFYNVGQNSGVITQIYYAPQVSGIYYRTFVSWFGTQWSAWKQLATTEKTDVVLKNGWVVTNTTHNKAVLTGDSLSMSLYIKSGTMTAGTIIATLPFPIVYANLRFVDDVGNQFWAYTQGADIILKTNITPTNWIGFTGVLIKA